MRARVLPLLTALGLACASAAELPFETAIVDYRPVVRERLLDGTVEAVNRSTVSAQIAGTVQSIAYDVEDYVEKGAVLLRFRDQRLRAGYEQAAANEAEARARAEEAEREQARLREMFNRKLVAQAQMDKADATLQAARARVQGAAAALAEARERLDYTIVRAPYSGIVTERHVQVGETTTPGSPLMSGVSLENLRVTVQVPQRRVEAVRRSRQARVILDDGAVVHSTDLVFFPYADPRSNTFEVRVNLQGVQGKLFPGMFVKVAFAMGTDDRLLVPLRAVAYRSELTAVYVVEADGRVSLRQIRAGRRIEDMLEVLAGLGPGERVALDVVAAGVYLKSGARASTP